MITVYYYGVIALFSIWPILVFESANINENISVSVFFVFVFINLIIGTLLFHGLRLVFRQADPASIAAAVAIGISALYTFRVVREVLLFVDLYSHVHLVVTWSVFFAVLVIGAWMVVSSEKAIRGMAGVGALMVVVAASPVFSNVLTTPSPKTASFDAGDRADLGDAVSHPNIYYFLMDAYARSDEILKMTGFDNRPFLDWLAARGFKTLSKSRSNYFRTRHSIPSSWIMDYMPGSDEGYITLDAETWEIMGGNNPTVRTFKEMGYRYVYSGGREYCKKYADKCISGIGLLQGAPWIIVHSTPIPALVYFVSSNLYASLLTKHNDLPMKQAIKGIGALEISPRFVFYHEFAVHRTIYNADCTYREGLALEEVDRMDHDQQMLHSREAYVSAVQCANTNLKKLVSTILAKEKDAIIVITADHGASFRPFNMKNRRENLKNVSYLRELSSTLSSWRLPDRCQKWLPDNLSNVNHFRLITACLLNKEPTYLPFKSYYFLTPGSTDSGPVVMVPNSVLRDE